MFERFTDRARRVVVLAQEEARLLQHNYIGTEHLLLGLLTEQQGIAGQTLTALDIDSEKARQQIEEMIGKGPQPPTGHIPFTPRAKKVMELALREALQLGHNYIGTEHILLGLIREGEGVAAQILVQLGAGLNQVRIKVLQILQGELDARVKRVEQDTKPAPRPEDEQLALQLEQIARQVRVYTATETSIRRTLDPTSGLLTYKLKFAIEGWKGEAIG